MPATSKRTRSPRTVLLRMAADQDRADRIRQLKQDNPQLRWRHIADHVGVELRSAQMWQETGAISYDNAKRLATLFPDVDVDWIMRGTTPAAETPSPFAGTDALQDRLDSIDARLERIEQILSDRDETDWTPERLLSLVRREYEAAAQTPEPAPRKRAARRTPAAST